MKKNGILNNQISNVLSMMRHTDKIAIGDLGLPVPTGVKEIDIALSLGEPSFLAVLKEVLKDLKIEKVIIAEEIKSTNRIQLDMINNLLNSLKVEVEFVKHEEFKILLDDTKAVIRTGEVTPYSNIILQSGVIF